MSNVYVLKFKKGDVEIEVHGDRNFVERKFEELYGKVFEAIVHVKEEPVKKPAVVEKAPPKPVKKPEKAVAEALDPKDVKEFVRSFKTPTNTEKMLVAARYLRDKAKKKSFTLSDIKSVYKIMRWELSKNPSSFLAKFRKRKFIYQLPQKRDGKPLYMMTEQGVKYTEGLKK